MFIIDYIKKVISMFKKEDIQKITGKPPVISSALLAKIAYWNNMYSGHAEWVDGYIKSLGLEQGICREFADCTLSELTTSVSNEKLDAAYKQTLEMLTENLQSGIALGSFCIKPLSENTAEFVTADKFIPLSFSDSGKPTSLAFVTAKQIKSDSIYRKFEIHEIKGDILSIKNMCYHSTSENDIGKRCNLAEVEDWANLPEETSYNTKGRNLFGYYRNPIKNTIDDTFCGVSIYDNAIQLIKNADVQYGRLEWEFESGERAINVDITALKPQAILDNGKTTLVAPKLNERLYKGLNLQTGDNAELYKEFSPAFRDSNIINGLEQHKRAIEFAVGLSYGDLSNTQSVEKTATEIKHAKQRKYNRVNVIESKLKECLEDYCYGLACFNNCATSGYEFICNFSDSILTDEETERKQDIQDVSIGALPLWRYIMKWQGLTEDEAKAQALEGAGAEVLE